jgi:hypothetical protein
MDNFLGTHCSSLKVSVQLTSQLMVSYSVYQTQTNAKQPWVKIDNGNQCTHGPHQYLQGFSVHSIAQRQNYFYQCYQANCY